MTKQLYQKLGLPDATKQWQAAGKKTTGGVRIGGILYPSQDWYDKNITAKGKEAVGGREVAIEKPTVSAKPVQPAEDKKRLELTQQTEALRREIQRKRDIMATAKGAGYGPGEDIPEGILAGGPGKVKADAGIDVGAGVGAGIGAGVGARDPRDELIDKLTTALTAAQAGPTMEEQWGALKEERGVPGMKEKIGSFDEEIGKFQDLLSDLEVRVRGGVAKEAGRLAPMELLTGRQQELSAQAGVMGADVLAGLTSAQRGRGQLMESLEREEADIMTTLGLRAEERKKPLEALQEEVKLRKSIRDLTKVEIPNVVSSTFDDAGDLTIITQDPNTGAFSTNSIKGIGKKAKEYTNFSTQTDDYGNVSVIGISPEGTAKILGTFEGVAGVKGTGEVSESKEFTRVKQIVKAHPNEWGHAADAIDQEFGKGTATKYDDYLKSVYQEEEPELSKKEIVWMWLDSDEAKALSDEEKASQIMKYGLDPETFNVYTY